VNRAGTTGRPGRELTTKLLAAMVPLSVVLPFIALSALASETDSGAVQHSGHILNGGSTGRQLLWFTGSAGLQLHTPPSCINASSVPEAAQYVGIAIGWISAVVYLCSRIPQVRPRREHDARWNWGSSCSLDLQPKQGRGYLGRSVSCSEA
jgi:hypothetical protein